MHIKPPSLQDTLLDIARAGAGRLTPSTGICPVCNGSKRTPLPEHSRQWAHVIAGYDKATDSLPCDNCTPSQLSEPTGVVPLRADGHPCAHEFREVSTAHQSMHGEHHYVCGACSTRKYIDSSG
jgi:hypothetical protein